MAFIAAGPPIATKRQGRKNRIIGTVSLGGSAAAFFSAAWKRISRFFLGGDAQGLAHRRAVFLGLVERDGDSLDAGMAAALGQIVEGLAATGQAGQFGGGEGEFLGQLGGLDADLGGDLLEGAFHRHAGFDADQHQVERVGKGLHNRGAAARDDVGNKKVGQVIAEQRAGHRRRHHHHETPFEMGNDEKVEQRDGEDDERHHEAEEHEGDQRRLAAKTRHRQLVAAVVGFQAGAQLELVQHRLHQRRGFDAQRAARGAEGGMMLGAQFLAALGHRVEAIIQAALFQQRQHQHGDGGEGEDADEHRHQEGAFEERVHEYVHGRTINA